MLDKQGLIQIYKDCLVSATQKTVDLSTYSLLGYADKTAELAQLVFPNSPRVYVVGAMKRIDNFVSEIANVSLYDSVKQQV